MNTIFRWDLIIYLLPLLLLCPCERSGPSNTKSMAFSSIEDRHKWVMDFLLPKIERFRWVNRSIPRGDGLLIREMVTATNRRQGLELGSGNGYSAIWIGMGLEKTKGHLDPVEINGKKVKKCMKNVRLAGLETTVRCLQGDAFEVSSTIKGPFDLLFLDLGPIDMTDIVRAVEPQLGDGAIIMLHNIDFMQSYERLLQYAILKRWSIEMERPKDGNGYGFIVISI